MIPTPRTLLTWFPALLAPLLSGCGVLDTIEARQLAREGNALYMAFDYRGAIQKYNQAIDLDTDIPNVYLNLGYSHFSIYDPSSESAAEKDAAKQAVGAFEEHLKRHPEDEAARVFLIKILLKAAPFDQELADRAHQTFLGMLSKNPDDHEARQYLITLFIDGKRYEDAVEFFSRELEKKPDDIETMKILAIIADKSDQVQNAVDWYWRRAEVTDEPEKKAVLLYEVGTYAWNLLHYQPERQVGIDAIKLADQGIEASVMAMKLKEKYAEAMVYANLLYLKRAYFETDEVARSWDQKLAFDLRVEAGKILGERRKKKEQEKKEQEEKEQAEGKPEEGKATGDNAG
jgi:Flp pilus assembly protein TadD